MNKHLIQIAAALLAVSMLAACSNETVLPTASDAPQTSRSATTTFSDVSSDQTTVISSETEEITTTALQPAVTDPPVTDPPVTTADPSHQMIQAVLDVTPFSAAYMSVYDLTNQRLLYTTGEDQRIYPASTTKLLTVLYALTVVDGDDVMEVGEEIKLAPADSSKAWISIDQKFTVRDLVAAMLLPSGNDAAYTLAVGCGRKIAENDRLSAADALGRFMDGMNEYASALGLSASHFVTPDGYHDPDHYTTLGDMTVVARLASENPLMAEIMAMPSYTAKPLNFGNELTWENTNLLLSESSSYYVPSAIGMKTGYHSDAGACLIASAERGGRTLIVLLFKGDDRMSRFADAGSILELCFSILDA